MNSMHDIAQMNEGINVTSNYIMGWLRIWERLALWRKQGFLGHILSICREFLEKFKKLVCRRSDVIFSSIKVRDRLLVACSTNSGDVPPYRSIKKCFPTTGQVIPSWIGLPIGVDAEHVSKRKIVFIVVNKK
jgi:hypothetical protein